MIFWNMRASKGVHQREFFVELLYLVMRAFQITPFLLRFRHAAALILFLKILFLSADAQIYLGADGAYSFETITLREATITRGYKVALMSQGSLRLRYSPSERFGLRLGLGWMPKGARVFFAADSVNGYPEGWTQIQARYVAGRFGVEIGTNIKDGFSVAGTMDFVLGKLAQSRRKLPETRKYVSFNDFFTKSFFGLDFGISLQYKLPSGFGVRFVPTLEIQLNQAYQSNFFFPEFRGFAPKFEIFIPLIKE